MNEFRCRAVVAPDLATLGVSCPHFPDYVQRLVAFYLENIVDRTFGVRPTLGTANFNLQSRDKNTGFVCDLVNQEVVEVSPDGKKIGAIKVPWPDKVAVSRKTGSGQKQTGECDQQNQFAAAGRSI